MHHGAVDNSMLPRLHMHCNAFADEEDMVSPPPLLRHPMLQLHKWASSHTPTYLLQLPVTHLLTVLTSAASC
jgi:hypothetical protein